MNSERINDFLWDLMFSNTDHQQGSQVHPLLEQQRKKWMSQAGVATKDIVSLTKYHLAGGQALKTWHNWGDFPICPNGKLSFGWWFIILRFLINYSSPLAQGTLIHYMFTLAPRFPHPQAFIWPKWFNIISPRLSNRSNSVLSAVFCLV